MPPDEIETPQIETLRLRQCANSEMAQYFGANWRSHPTNVLTENGVVAPIIPPPFRGGWRAPPLRFGRMAGNWNLKLMAQLAQAKREKEN